MDPVNSKTLYVADFDDIFGDTWAPLIKSTDGGLSWVCAFLHPSFRHIGCKSARFKNSLRGNFRRLE